MWINTTLYTPLELMLFISCCLLWAVVYGIIIRNIIKFKFVEIPVAAVCANIAWEFLWSFVYVSNMGLLFTWAYRVWFFFDLYIVYAAFVYGDKQTMANEFKKFFRLSTALGIALWLIALFYFIPEHDTDGFGALSGYVLSVYMGSLYCFQIVRQPDFARSMYASWLKMIGTGSCSVMCYIHFWDVKGYGCLLALCAITLFLDCLYIYLHYKSRKATTLTL